MPTDTEAQKKCAQTKVSLSRKDRYYRNGFYYKNKAAFKKHWEKLQEEKAAAKAQAEEEAKAAAEAAAQAEAEAAEAKESEAQDETAETPQEETATEEKPAE